MERMRAALWPRRKKAPAKSRAALEIDNRGDVDQASTQRTTGALCAGTQFQYRGPIRCHSPRRPRYALTDLNSKRRTDGRWHGLDVIQLGCRHRSKGRQVSRDKTIGARAFLVEKEGFGFVRRKDGSIDSVASCPRAAAVTPHSRLIALRTRVQGKLGRSRVVSHRLCSVPHYAVLPRFPGFFRCFRPRIIGV